jgi:hypothetical protein
VRLVGKLKLGKETENRGWAFGTKIRFLSGKCFFFGARDVRRVVGRCGGVVALYCCLGQRVVNERVIDSFVN